MILIDTSVWVEAFRLHGTVQIERYAPTEEIVLCLPVYQELLQGFRDEGTFRRVREILREFPILESPLDQSVVDEAVDLYRAARRQGITVRSSVDCLIAAIAIRHDVTLFHRDRDYPGLAEISSLKVKSL